MFEIADVAIAPRKLGAKCQHNTTRGDSISK